MSQDNLNIKETETVQPSEPKKDEPIVYKNWLIIYWSKNRKPELLNNIYVDEATITGTRLYIKQPDVDGVIEFCRLRGIDCYCVFNDKHIQVAVDGRRLKI